MIFHNKNEDEQIVELEHKKRDYYNYIANEIKDIQTQAASLKNPEDKYKVLNTLLKIKDICSSIQKAYSQLDDIEDESIFLLNNQEKENEKSWNYYIPFRAELRCGTSVLCVADILIPARICSHGF